AGNPTCRHPRRLRQVRGLRSLTKRNERSRSELRLDRIPNVGTLNTQPVKQRTLKCGLENGDPLLGLRDLRFLSVHRTLSGLILRVCKEIRHRRASDAAVFTDVRYLSLKHRLDACRPIGKLSELRA